ncbi:MAG: EI24 domain-containing protein [Flavobacteriales bacterium]
MMKDFLTTVKAYPEALFLVKKLNLWKYFFVPALISLGFAVLLSFSIYCLSDDIGVLLSNFYSFTYGKKWVESVANLIGGLLILGVGLVFYKHIVMALSAPFMSPLSEKVEEYLTGVYCKTPSMSKSLIRGIRINVRNLFLELFIVIPCTLLSFIPVIGLGFTFLSFLTQAYYAGFGNMDYTLERHLNYQNSIYFVKQNRPIAIGNGMLYMLMLLIPMGIVFISPISATAATISTIKKLNVNTKQWYV